MFGLTHMLGAMSANPILGASLTANGAFPWVTVTTFGPLLGVLVLMLMPKNQERALRTVALFVSLGVFVISLGLMLYFNPALTPITSHAFTFQMTEGPVNWIKPLGIHYYVGIDGISLWLVLLTTFLMPITILSTYKAVHEHVREYMIALLFLETAIIGALVSLDVFLFYVFWEMMLIPMYLIIGVWGAEERIKAAVKFFLFTMVGSVLMLVAILYVYFKAAHATGHYSFMYSDLMAVHLTFHEQVWLFLAFFLAFAIKVPLFPLHTWLPHAHVQAPTAGSVILAGVLLKMGTYGLLRYGIPMFPDAVKLFAPYIAVMCVVGIVYGALLAMVQTNVKKLVAYSSVSHLGFCVLGLIAMTPEGVAGALYIMLAHGIATGGLFLCVGILYERRHTKEISEFGGIARVMPVFATLFMVIVFASAGLPGLNGFVGEFLSLLGTVKSHFLWFHSPLAFIKPAGHATGFGVFHLKDVPYFPMAASQQAGPEITAFIFAIVATSGVIWGAAYLLWMWRRVMFGPVTKEANKKLKDVNAREIAYLVPIVLMAIFMGVFPKFFLSRMEPSIHQFLGYMDSHVSAHGSVVVEDVNPSWVPKGPMVGKSTAAPKRAPEP